MDTLKIKRMIGHCSIHAQLSEVIEAARNRQETLRKQASDRANVKALAWAKTLKKGDTFYCAMPGTRLWQGYQYGDKLIVKHWQPRKKILWFTFNGVTYWAAVVCIAEDRFQNEKPKPKAEMLTHSMAASLGKTFHEHL